MRYCVYYNLHTLNSPITSQWVVDALRTVNVDLMADAPEGVRPAQNSDAVWDHAEIKRQQ